MRPETEPRRPSAAPFDVMLTCYTLFERESADQKLDRSFLRSWRWSHLVLDEAHAVRPPAPLMPVGSQMLLPPRQLSTPCGTRSASPPDHGVCHHEAGRGGVAAGHA